MLPFQMEANTLHWFSGMQGSIETCIEGFHPVNVLLTQVRVDISARGCHHSFQQDEQMHRTSLNAPSGSWQITKLYQGHASQILSVFLPTAALFTATSLVSNGLGLWK